MIYWTIQHRNVLDILNKQGRYLPDFKLSPQVHRDTYDKLLRIFNELNGTSYKGLVFCIAKDCRTKGPLTFQDEVDFAEYMNARRGVLKGLHNGAYTLLDNDHLLCRVETDKFDRLYLCLVDFWNFIMMMPDKDGVWGSQNDYEMCRASNPAFEHIAYEDFVELAWKTMRERKIVRPLMSSTILQATIPYLEKEMLKGTYSLAEFGSNL